MDINKIKYNIDFLTEEVKLLSLKLIDNDSPILKTQIESLNLEIRNLQNELRKYNEIRNKEVISLRLMGEIAKNGTFPLISVGGITDSFANAIFKTSQYLQYGIKGGKKIEKILNENLDLRLEALGQGSTIFYISAKTNPDLFGNSIIQNSLESTFELLRSEQPHDLIENIENIGINSAKYYKNFFGELLKDNLEIEISWEDYNFETKKWFGTKQKLLQFYNTFDNINTLEPEYLVDDFEIITLSLKNRIEARDIISDKIINIKYSQDFIDLIKTLHVGEVVTLNYSKTTIINEVTKKEKFQFNLME
ncbi:hypothetical protein [Chryseobacterium indoltheticum]|uniref:Uncharacterized protein n=1 Tax=Chryseobacterium indoltheticum TaxID=254 RepID=A0A381FFC0_9FLAO|nr:hypothetical protein [Chryseobacterium indoltheticum]SUX45158.1 Uncharacterised protein [Chryseobacterium indoltheticum]